MEILAMEFAAVWGPILIPLMPVFIVGVVFLTILSAATLWFFPVPEEGESPLAIFARELTGFYSRAPRGVWGVSCILVTAVLFKANGYMVDMFFWRPAITTPLEILCFILSATVLGVENKIRSTHDEIQRALLISSRFEGLDDYIEQLKRIDPPPEILEHDETLLSNYNTVDVKYAKRRIITTYRFCRGDKRYVFEHEHVGGETTRFNCGEFEFSERGHYECIRTYDWAYQNKLIFAGLVLSL